ncbi:MAG: GNAT family N-acetyltransferase [Candidatus Paceibacterota bacterium]|jgi:GNAT superfamily N-acetyltransferase
MNFEITKYKKEDYANLESMVFGLYNEDSSEADEEAMTRTKVKNTVVRSVSNPDQIKIEIFRVGNKVVGYAFLTFYWSNEYGGVVALLDELYIIPEFRNKGLATFFIEHLTKEKEYKVIDLEVFKENTSALKLYKRLGFEIIDRHFMKKKL